MSGTVTDWLPASVVDRSEVRAAVRDAVSDWSARWFSGRSVRAETFARIKPEAAADGQSKGWRVHRRLIGIRCAPGSMVKLRAWALDARSDDAPVTEADRRLVAAFDETLIEDLALRLESAFGYGREVSGRPSLPDHPPAWRGGVVVGLACLDGGELMSVAVPLQAIVAMCKASAPRSQRAPVMQGPLSEALGGTSVTVEAFLGNAEISFADLKGLAQGDVLILDTALDGKAQLFLEGAGQPFANASLTIEGGKFALSL